MKATKFLGGAVTGAALAMAASAFMHSKAGQKMSKEVRAHVEDFFDDVTPKIKKMGKVTEEQYHEFIDEAVFKYSKLKKLSRQMTQHLLKEARHSWKEFAKEMKS